jgi:hypothetical protein
MGRLVRSATSNGLTGNHAIYWQDDSGSRHWVTDGDEVNRRGGWNAVQLIADAGIAAMPVGHSVGSIRLGHRSLVRAGAGPDVYYIEDTARRDANGEQQFIHRRRWIPYPQSFANWGLSWDDIAQVPRGELETVPEGPNVPLG